MSSSWHLFTSRGMRSRSFLLLLLLKEGSPPQFLPSLPLILQGLGQGKLHSKRKRLWILLAGLIASQHWHCWQNGMSTWTWASQTIQGWPSTRRDHPTPSFTLEPACESQMSKKIMQEAERRLSQTTQGAAARRAWTTNVEEEITWAASSEESFHYFFFFFLSQHFIFCSYTSTGPKNHFNVWSLCLGHWIEN